ncbi:SDR family NAD(P)-dependent oxidoreductase [Phyllobacterium sophorae]|uniref:3-oxoacyl-ACP reductase n=1 Tax=Phyllobacterium sophorae TaxID=1520277 RepID=A0A2P7B6P0_9HYPH|nr:SDR family NAD(P)-dependent oxidoreductase [Phyllobacterium sophorae]PSH62137.1 3-oxoacyl-ACP reductase [Phyllobacterium sophorae]
MPGTLRGKTAVVTGGARGIGRGIAKRLSDDGARIAVWDLAFPGDMAPINADMHVEVDVCDPTSVEAATSKTLGAFGHIDILVNNAGINGPVVEAWSYPEDDWKRVMAVNLDGVFHCCRAVVPSMKERGYGRLINISSIAGKEGGSGISAYAASKAGVIGFTKSLARELAGTGVLANCVAPAITETDLFKEMTAEHIAAAKGKIPMARFLTISEIAAMVSWMASDEMTFTTGFTFDLTGGRATY